MDPQKDSLPHMLTSLLYGHALHSQEVQEELAARCALAGTYILYTRVITSAADKIIAVIVSLNSCHCFFSCPRLLGQKTECTLTQMQV